MFCEIRVVLVHGFKSSRTRHYKEYLEHWLYHSTHKDFVDTVRASAFSFDIYDVLKKGEKELDNASRRLVDKIRLLQVSRAPTINVPSSLAYKELRKEEVGRFQNSTSLNPQKFLFVAHGIGSWIVKNGLARYDNLRLSLETAGVIFLDIENYDWNTFNYSNYLGGLSKGFSLRESSVEGSSEDLANRLKEIDENWQNLMLSKSKYVKKYQVLCIKSRMDDLRMVGRLSDKKVS
jgi:hypothetical protein